tara:strand:- start:467 stop:919 length:453 start_codon:yes stop_codon:yes gene_type:complete
MKYKITELTTSAMKVVYEDNTYAMIPIYKTYDKALLKSMIANHHNVDKSYEKIEDIPLQLNYEGDTEDEEDTSVPNEYSYKAMREIEYPFISDQCDAMYKLRQGDDSDIKKIDEAIKDIKEKYPKNDKKYTDLDIASAYKWTHDETALDK